jgi:hypothetical protein
VVAVVVCGCMTDLCNAENVPAGRVRQKFSGAKKFCSAECGAGR